MNYNPLDDLHLNLRRRKHGRGPTLSIGQIVG
jgi:hypothetical protein